MTTVETASGIVRGRARDRTWLFAGIPYAAPPTGDGRFAPPQPPVSWSGVRDATAFGPSSWQSPGALDLLSGPDLACSEDCLSLNITTPAGALGSGGRVEPELPVLVWIHGGGFIGGTGATPWYDGKSFAQNGDVVVVTINYRLGALGFAHLGEVDPSFPDTGVNGLLDQIAALEWVHDNIGAFGGDRDNVTVFGESAGAMSVSCLLAMPRARGLFHRAIAQSGAGNAVLSPDDAALTTERLLAELDVSTIDELLGVEPDRLLAAQQVLIDEVRSPGGNRRAESQRRGTEVGDSSPPATAEAAIRFAGLPFMPVLGGSLPAPPLEAVRAGSADAVELICGTNLDEWALFDLMADNSKMDAGRAARRAERLVPGGESIYHAYAERRADLAPAGVLSAMMTDTVFRIPAIRLAEAHASRNASSTRCYLFTWRTKAFDGKLGSCHALEIPFVWDNLHKGGADVFLGGERPQGLAEDMHGAWWRFATDGQASHDGIGAWPTYDGVTRSTMRFDTSSAVVSDPAGDDRELWDGVI